MIDIARFILNNKDLFTRMEGKPSAILARRLKLARFDKQNFTGRVTPSLGSTILQSAGKL